MKKSDRPTYPGMDALGNFPHVIDQPRRGADVFLDWLALTLGRIGRAMTQRTR